MNDHFYQGKRFLRYFLSGILVFFSLFAKSANPSLGSNQEGLRLSTFDIDVTPPIGSFLAYGSVENDWDLGLRARGIVLLGAGQPIVLCSVDWIGIGNEGHDAFCNELARAAGTTPDRIAVHTGHPHDTPWCDFGAEKILIGAGFPPTKYDGTFNREVIARLVVAVRKSLENSKPFDRIGFGEAKVYKVASNRRIAGKDGNAMATRLSSCTDPSLRAEPEGLIDPMVSLVSFWNGDQPVAVLSYYAVHPQSYYRTNITNPDYPAIARFSRQLKVPQALHVHFNGAGGNVAAGKYNDGSMENRGILAKRLEDGMERAWKATKKVPVKAGEIKWNVEPVSFTPAKHLYLLENESPDSLLVKCNAARLAWLHRCQAGKKVDISCLSLGKVRIIHLPGEPFVEYQLAAKAERKDLHVAVAGYGDYGPGYIGTTEAYSQGGYETSHVSNVSPDTEKVLMAAIRKLLH